MRSFRSLIDFRNFCRHLVVEFNSIVRQHTFFPNLGSDPIFADFTFSLMWLRYILFTKRDENRSGLIQISISNYFFHFYFNSQEPEKLCGTRYPALEICALINARQLNMESHFSSFFFCLAEEAHGRQVRVLKSDVSQTCALNNSLRPMFP